MSLPFEYLKWSINKFSIKAAATPKLRGAFTHWSYLLQVLCTKLLLLKWELPDIIIIPILLMLGAEFCVSCSNARLSQLLLLHKEKLSLINANVLNTGYHNTTDHIQHQSDELLSTHDLAEKQLYKTFLPDHKRLSLCTEDKVSLE